MPFKRIGRAASNVIDVGLPYGEAGAGCQPAEGVGAGRTMLTVEKSEDQPHAKQAFA
jgi:hypothetical protein